MRRRGFVPPFRAASRHRYCNAPFPASAVQSSIENIALLTEKKQAIVYVCETRHTAHNVHIHQWVYEFAEC